MWLNTTAANPELTRLENWINIRVIQAVVHHASAVIVALILFWAVGFLMEHLLHDGPIKPYVKMFDQVVLVGLFAYLAWELFTSL